MENSKIQSKFRGIPSWAGVGIILTGITIFVDLRLKTGWIIIIPLTFLTVSAFVYGYSQKRKAFISFSLAAFFLGASALVFFTTQLGWNVRTRLGIVFLIIGCFWFSFGIVRYVLNRYADYWLLIPALSGVGLGLSFLSSRQSFLDYMVFIGVSIGLGMLLWGLGQRLFGLIIPGSLLVSSCLGVYLGWNPGTAEPNALARTGVMLVVFGIGWACITLFSKRSYSQAVWWPLIPALVISVTGWGLYIGGNPSDAGKFIGNTGSITLVILGAYVLLLRQGFHKNRS
ncbi:MAG: hypothetical protein HPY85_04440 [Anaerolineae bacterium]|nr:hypothetical protein [Anaerolineae bacterium]